MPTSWGSAWRGATALAVTVAVAAGLAVPAARGQIIDDPESTTTTEAPPDGGGGAESTTTTRPRSTTTSEPSGGGDSADDAPITAQNIPPDVRRLINSVKRSKANNTQRLLDALQPLVAGGMTSQDAAVVGMGRFPVAGYATFTDDWWNPRFTPSFHLHEGTDIFAAHGTPVRSPVEGTIRLSTEGIGGLAVYVTQADRSYFYLAHLSAFVEGQATGQKVRAGQVVGFVGDSGNARGGTPHVHFEIHPRGGGPINPKPYLDQWIDEALKNAPRLVGALDRGKPRAVVATGLTRRFADGRSGPFAAPVAPSLSGMLWASAANTTGGPLQLAEAAAAAAAREVDWNGLAQRQLRRQLEWQQADALARQVLSPLTPAALRPVLDLPPVR